MRNWGSVRIPVRVKRVEPELRRPVVTCWSVGPTGIKVEVLPAEAGTPGNHPVVFPAVLPVKREGWVPPDPQIVRLFMRTLPKYQSKPRALASSWETSTNLALMLTWGGEALMVPVYVRKASVLGKLVWVVGFGWGMKLG